MWPSSRIPVPAIRGRLPLRFLRLNRALAEQLRRDLGEVRDGEVCAGAADACQRLQNGAVVVQPAVLDGGG